MRLVAAIAIVMFGTGMLLLAAGQGPTDVPATSPSPSPSPAATRLLPAVIPDDIPNGVIDTPLGQARWAHLTGDPESLPALDEPLPGPNGLLWLDRVRIPCDGSSEQECPFRYRLWASADAISERSERSLPIESEGAELTPLDGTWWLTTNGPTSLWRSTDAERWEQVDLGALITPGTAELEWEVSLGVPASSGGTTVVPVTYQARDAGRLLGYPDAGEFDPGDFIRPERDASGSFRVIDADFGDLGEVRIEETAYGLSFTDIAGNTVATLEGVDMDFIDDWSASGALVEHQVGRVEDGKVTPATLPGERLFDEWRQGPTVFGTSDGFHAYHATADGTVRTWRSDDGSTWEELDPLGAAEGEPQATSVERGEHLGSGYTSVIVGDSERSWESTDGITWQPIPVLSEDTIRRVGDGWLVGRGGDWRASVDGTTWLSAPELDAVTSKRELAGAGSSRWVVIGDTLLWAVLDEEGARPRDLWIVEFEKTSD
jgi:hypothetical protein